MHPRSLIRVVFDIPPFNGVDDPEGVTVDDPAIAVNSRKNSPRLDHVYFTNADNLTERIIASGPFDYIFHRACINAQQKENVVGVVPDSDGVIRARRP